MPFQLGTWSVLGFASYQWEFLCKFNKVPFWEIKRCQLKFDFLPCLSHPSLTVGQRLVSKRHFCPSWIFLVINISKFKPDAASYAQRLLRNFQFAEVRVARIWAVSSPTSPGDAPGQGQSVHSAGCTVQSPHPQSCSWVQDSSGLLIALHRHRVLSCIPFTISEGRMTGTFSTLQLTKCSAALLCVARVPFLIKPKSFRIWQTPGITFQGWLRFLIHDEQVSQGVSLREGQLSSDPLLFGSTSWAQPDFAYVSYPNIPIGWLVPGAPEDTKSYIHCLLKSLTGSGVIAYKYTHTFMYLKSSLDDMCPLNIGCVINDYIE